MAHDEIGRAGESFNAMFNRVNEVMKQVKDAVNTITTGTSEINAGTSDLVSAYLTASGFIGRNECLHGGNDLDH